MRLSERAKRASLLALSLGLLTSGCANAMVAAPTAPDIHITVRTLWYGSNTPLGGVTVTQDGIDKGVTDDSGRLMLTFAPKDTTIHVARVGFVAFVPTAAGLPGNGETWTFWLELEN